MNLFAYGTLMFPEVWERVVGRAFAAERATISGFAVRRVVDDVYPVLIHADKNSGVAGLVFRNIDHDTLARLDDYESDFYQRLEVIATLSNSESLACHAYVLPEHNRDAAGAETWNADEFTVHSLARYLQRLR
jgi:gamma-glutamylcyclotransferase (GGCT)/AIG2-like uncharacterized protein YtfP